MKKANAESRGAKGLIGWKMIHGEIEPIMAIRSGKGFFHLFGPYIDHYLLARGQLGIKAEWQLG